MGKSEFDPYGLVGSISIVLIILSFVLVLRAQYQLATKANYGMVVIALRATSLLPIFMLFIFLSLWTPLLFPFYKVPAAIFEGYGVYCIWALIVRNCGGPEGSIKVMIESKRGICWPLSTDEQCRRFYSNANTAIWQFAVLRWISVALGCIFFYAEVQEVYIICSVIAAVSTVYMLPYLFMSAHVLLDACSGLNILVKLALVKVSVGLILIEDLVMQFLYQSGKVHMPDTDGLKGYDQEDRFTRVYCTMALVEGVLLAVVMYYGFAPAMEIRPEGLESTSVSASDLRACTSYKQFLYDLWNVFFQPCSAVVNFTTQTDVVSGTTIKNNLLHGEVPKSSLA